MKNLTFLALAALVFVQKVAAQDTLFIAQKADCAVALPVDLSKNYIVETTSGAGANSAELDGVSCFAGSGAAQNEVNSTWLTWTAEKNALLEFKITPINQFDDLDFVLFGLPQSGCAAKIQLRCMASSCYGPTGLLLGETDFSEPPNCLIGQNNFLAPLTMLEGQTFALAINNFSATGAGFLIEFKATEIVAAPEIVVEKTAFRLAPNPASDVLTVEFSNDFLGKIEILDASGRSLERHFLQNEKVKNLPIGHLPSGLFWLRATNEKGSIAQKFMHFD